MSESRHIAVMAREVIEALKPRFGGRYIDATLGGGTHTRDMLLASAPDGRVLSFDLDHHALERAERLFRSEREDGRWLGVEANFASLAEVAEREGFSGCQGIVADLGFSSDELEDPDRGLSFQADGPLDMRFRTSSADGLTAAGIVNGWTGPEIERVLRDYGEERFAGRIADAVLKARKRERLIRVSQLVDVIIDAVPVAYERGRIHPATRTFQALRIAVNDEIENLKNLLTGARHVLAPGGRLAIISFHSLEDRIVKQAFRDSDDLRVVTKKPLVPSDQECRANPRSRSAKLRVAEKIDPSSSYSKHPKQKPSYVPSIRHQYDQTA